MVKRFEVYEICNPSFNDMNIEQQIEAGINLWLCVGLDNREFIRESREAAYNAAKQYSFGRISL